MSDRRTFVVVGAGMAGGRAATALRDEGFDGRVVLLGDEDVPPYDRVPLSKQRLRGEPGGHRLFIHDEEYYRQQNIELRLGERVVSVDAMARRVELGSGEVVDYGTLLLATGASARRLHIRGGDLDGVAYLRTLADCDRLHAAITPASRVVVIGAGWVGCEVAASARQMGAEVAMVDVGGLPLARVLGPEMGRFYRELHAEHGVRLHLGVGVQEMTGSDRIEQVHLADGTVLEADVVVVGIGVEPRVALAEAAGIDVNDGIVTDERLATSAAGVYAAGDVANTWRPSLGTRLRLEHWAAALDQGPAAARNMLGITTVYDPVPFFFSDQYDVWMEYSGHADPKDHLVIRGDVARREFIAFWQRDGRVSAGMNVNIRGVVDAIAALVASASVVDPDVLADPEVDLASVVPVTGQ